MIIKPLTFLTAITLTTVTMTNTGCTHSTGNDTTQARVEQQIDSVFNNLFGPDEPGAAVVITRGDSIVYAKGFGMADLAKNEPITVNTSFNICSISKQFGAMALLKLAEQGKLSLDDSIVKYFPNLTQPFFKDVTLRHMLSHTSGIPDSRPRNEAEWKEYRKRHDSKFANVRDYILFSEEDESWQYMEDLERLNFDPGTQYEYMNPTFQMILSIVEQVTGENFDRWMRDNIFNPAGMKETLYFEPDSVIENMAHGYDLAEGENVHGYFRSADGKWEECDYGEAGFFVTKADGGIYTTPMDFVQWDKAVYGVKIVGDQWLGQAHTPHIATDIPHTGYGYGWFIENRPGWPLKIYHTGDNGGFHTFAGRFPQNDLAYLVFSNRPDWNREEAVAKIDDILREAGWLENANE